MSVQDFERYWQRTSSLMIKMIALWFIFGIAVHFFAPQLNAIKIFGFPLGFYMAAQGSLIAFLLMCFYNARAQNAIDEEFGVSDE